MNKWLLLPCYPQREVIIGVEIRYLHSKHGYDMKTEYLTRIKKRKNKYDYTSSGEKCSNTLNKSH